jgi:hypothetical protein
VVYHRTQHTAIHYSTLQRAATHCKTLQDTATQHAETHCSTPSLTAAQCNTLQHRSSLRGNKEVALAAVSRDGSTLKFVSDALKNDRDVVLRCLALQHTINTLQHTATHCNILQHTATHCNTLQHPATHCNTLQHIATHCNTLHHVEEPSNLCLDPLKNDWDVMTGTSVGGATHCNTSATHCNTPQHTTTRRKTTCLNETCHAATHCSTLQNTATHCNTL